jgi:hypothetical protein
VSESAVKRAVMEFYHEHKARMPAPVRAGYRIARNRLAANRRRKTPTAPALQYEFEGAVSPGRSDED